MTTAITGTTFRYRITEPLISPKAYEYVKQVLDQKYLSPGRWVRQFEERWAEACGVAHAVATSSGTAALHMALLAAGIGPGDEVVVPAMTCPDTLNAVTFTGAAPVIVDIERARFGMDPQRLRDAITLRTKAAIPVHLYGCIVDPAVFEVCGKRGVAVIEDAAEAHGSELEGRRAGSLGALGCFSFRGDKLLGVGTGGMVTTNDRRLAERARYLTGLASPGGFDRYFSTELSHSYEMSNVHAAIGLAQVEMLEPTMAAKRRVASWYDRLLSGASVEKPLMISGHVWWRYSVLLKEASPRDVHARMAEEGIETMPPFVPMYRIPMYADGYRSADFPVAEEVYRRLLSVPTSPYLTQADVEEIVRIFHRVLEAETHATQERR